MEKNFTVKDLLKRGWIRREDLNFSDDGTRFQAFEYEENGLIATYAKSNGMYHLALRLDYMNELNYFEYSTIESYKLCDQFNGVEEVDADKVTENAIQVMKEYTELLIEITSKEIDIQKLIKAASKELELVNKVLYDSNITIDEMQNIDKYDMTTLIEYRQTIKREALNKLNSLAKNGYTNSQLRFELHTLATQGYLRFNEDSYYITAIRKIVDKIRGNK